MEQVASGPVQIEPFGGRVGSHQDAHRRRRGVECCFDVLAIKLVHALGTAGPEQREHPFRRIALPQTASEVVERGLVLGENDQAFVVAKLSAGSEQRSIRSTSESKRASTAGC